MQRGAIAFVILLACGGPPAQAVTPPPPPAGTTPTEPPPPEPGPAGAGWSCYSVTGVSGGTPWTNSECKRDEGACRQVREDMRKVSPDAMFTACEPAEVSHCYDTGNRAQPALCFAAAADCATMLERLAHAGPCVATP